MPFPNFAWLETWISSLDHEEAAVPDDIMGYVGAVVDREVVAYVAGDDMGIRDAGGHEDVVMLDDVAVEPAEPHEARELAILDQLGDEGIRYAEELPSPRSRCVLHQGLDLMGLQAPVRGGLPLEHRAQLKVSDAVFVLAGAQGRGRDEAEPVGPFLDYLDIVHDFIEDIPLAEAPQWVCPRAGY